MLAPVRSRPAVVFGVAGLCLIAAGVTRYALDGILGDHASFSFFYLAVAVAAWTGGVWPAIITSFVSCIVANYFFTEPFGSLDISSKQELISLSMFLAVSAVIAVLAESSLRALERARAAEEAKDNLMAIVAHELRSPLSVIQYANELSRTSAPSTNVQYIELINRQVDELGFLVQELMDISRLTRGMINLERRVTNAATVLQRAIEKARPLIKDRRHRLKVDIASGDLEILADPRRLEQVLANLLINAAKYTPQGGKIEVCLVEEDRCARFSVRDNGIGISAELLPNIFELFTRADAAREASGEGLGIGLALVQRLVKLHDGRVEALSEGEGKGSEFIVCLPLHRAAHQGELLVKA